MRSNIRRSLIALLLVCPLHGQEAIDESQADAFIDLLQLMNTPVISASKSAEKLSEAPATMIVISKTDIDRRGYTQFREILEDLPSFDNMTTYGDFYVKSYVRGLRNNVGDSFLIMVDGMVFNHLWYNQTDSATTPLPLSNIERVEVVYGPASAMYGPNAFMGVINVITGKGTPNTTSLKVNLSGGSFQQRGIDLSWHQNLDTWGYSLTVRRYEGDLNQDMLNRYEYTSTKFWGSFQGHDMYGNLVDQYKDRGWSPWNTTAVDMRLWVGHLETGLEYLSLRSGYGTDYTTDHYYNPSTKWERPQWSFFVRYNYDLTPHLSTTATVRYRQDGASPSSPDWYTYWDSDPTSSTYKRFVTYPEYWVEVSSSTEFTEDFQWKVGKNLAFNFGGLFSEEKQQKNYLRGIEDGVVIDNSVVVPGDAGPRPIATLSDGNHFTLHRHATYLQGKYLLGEHQSIVLGIRDDWHSVYKGAVTIRGGYVGNWGGLNLKALYGQAYQEPTPRDLYGGWGGAGSSTTLRPQRSWTEEISAGYTVSRWSALLDIYKIRNSNLIATISSSAINSGTMEVTGIDLHGKLQFPGVLGKELSLWGYWTETLKAELTPHHESLNVTNSNDVGDIAKTKIHLGVTAQIDNDLFLTLKGQHIGARRVIATNPVGQVKAFDTCDLYIQYNRTPRLKIGLKVTNLFNTNYFEPGLLDANAGMTPATFDTSGNYHGSAGYSSSLLPQFGRGIVGVIKYQF